MTLFQRLARTFCRERGGHFGVALALSSPLAYASAPLPERINCPAEYNEIYDPSLLPPYLDAQHQFFQTSDGLELSYHQNMIRWDAHSHALVVHGPDCPNKLRLVRSEVAAFLAKKPEKLAHLFAALRTGKLSIRIYAAADLTQLDADLVALIGQSSAERHLAPPTELSLKAQYLVNMMPREEAAPSEVQARLDGFIARLKNGQDPETVQQEEAAVVGSYFFVGFDEEQKPVVVNSFDLTKQYLYGKSYHYARLKLSGKLSAGNVPELLSFLIAALMGKKYLIPGVIGEVAMLQWKQHLDSEELVFGSDASLSFGRYESSGFVASSLPRPILALPCCKIVMASTRRDL